MKAWMDSGNARNIVAFDVDACDNLTDEAIHRFVSKYGHQLSALALSGMPHITDQLWQAILPILKNTK